MKIIDLLNRIAENEGIPIKIKFKGKEYEWSQEFYDYKCIDINHKYLVEDLEIEDLNKMCEEIPIIEDEKIEPIKYEVNKVIGIGDCVEKINEIIDVINRGDKQ